MTDVLVVEDDTATRLILHRLLAQLQCDVRLAGNGIEALALIEQDCPDLVLLDLQMPVLDGIETLKAIRSSQVHPDLPVIAISPVSDRAAVLGLLHQGVADYILKPLKLELASRRLRKVLAGLSPRSPRRGSRPRRQGPPASRPQLLVVDGDAAFRTFVRQLMSPGFDVHEAATGRETIELYHAEPADVVCVAEQLAGLEPSMLARALKLSASAPRSGGVRIYLMSAAGASAEQDSPYHGVLEHTTVADRFLAGLPQADRSRSAG